VDSNQVVRPLKEDGTMDGIYTLGVNPYDGAGNNLDVNVFDNIPPVNGDYFGMKRSDSTTIDATGFTFLYDTIEPELSVTDFEDDTYIGGNNFTLNGTTRDLSANVASPTQGGAGILNVQYKLEVVDENGVPLASEPARQSTTNNDPGAWLPAQNNPVVPWTSSWISPIRKDDTPTDTGSNSPIRSTTFPMTTGFKGSQREIRTFRIDGTLPDTTALLKPRQNRTDPPDPNPDQTAKDYYKMSIRSWDRAGNFTEVAKRVIVSLDHVQPPVLTSPACGEWVSKLVVNFQWNEVQGATAYKFQLLYPDGNTLERQITNNQLQMTLSMEGEYRWRVASVDGTGNTGSFSQYCTLHLDRTPPEISQFFITANGVPPQQQGQLYLGDFTVQLEFSEPLDEDKWLSVTFDPLGAIGAPVQEITTATFTNTVSEANWTGNGNIPRTAKPENWDGQVTFKISGATDRAGNEMRTAYNGSYELETGPWFSTSFYSSIFNENEFTMVVESSDDLVQIPTLSNMQGLGWQGTDQTLRTFQGSQKTYYGTMKLLSSSNPNVNFDISGSDLDQNQARRTIEFAVSRPPNRSSTSSLNFAALSIKFPANSIQKTGPVYVFPPSIETEEGTNNVSSTISALSPELGISPESKSAAILISVIDSVLPSITSPLFLFPINNH